MRVALFGAAFFLLLATGADADIVRILDDPAEAAQARVDLIQQANDEIHALYFLARNDRITLTALGLLREARRRGVGSVKLVVDANFHRIPKSVLAHLADEGVEVRVYHPLNLRHPSWLWRRMHDKIVIVDGERYIAGGRNLAEAYFGLAPKKNYVDRDIYVHGESAVEADDHFEDVWSSRHVAALKVRVSPAEKKSAELALDQVLASLECDAIVNLNTGTDWSEGHPDVGDVVFMHDPVDGKGPRVAHQLHEQIAAAKKSIVIQSPYLIPSKPLMELLEKKLSEGVYVQITTNSLRSTDGLLPQAAYLRYRRRLARAGIDVREFKGPDSLHAKSAVIDGRIVLVGSYNVDPRSQNLNTEIMTMVESPVIAEKVLESIDMHLHNSWRIASNGRPSRSERYLRISRVTSLRLWAWRMVLPFIEGQL